MLVQIKDTKGKIVKEFEAKEVNESMLRNYPTGYKLEVVK